MLLKEEYKIQVTMKTIMIALSMSFFLVTKNETLKFGSNLSCILIGKTQILNAVFLLNSDFMKQYFNRL